MNCPFRNFEECPEHNKKGGCSFWLAYSSNKTNLEAQVSGCAIVLTPMLLLESANNMGVLAGEISKVSAEISASRSEAVQTGTAMRTQLLSLACGERVLVEPDYSNTLKITTSEIK